MNALTRLPISEMHTDLEKSVAWDRLWTDSMLSLPTLRRDCLASFIRTFANSDSFRAATVFRNQRLVAAIPLVTRRRLGIPYALSLPANAWMKCGELLVDPQHVDQGVFDELAEKILKSPGWLLSFDWIDPSAEWERLLTAFERNGCNVDRRRQFEVGMIDVQGTWDEFFAGRSRSHRKNMRRSWRQLERAGTVTFERHQKIADPGELQALMGEVIAVEQSGWKGQQGSSIGSDPAIDQYYREIASILDHEGMLEIQFLRLNGRPIAFEFGYVANKTWFSHKVGYDPEFASCSPGQLLLYRQLQDWFAGDEVDCVDTMGIISSATARWTTRVRPVFRYRITRPGSLDRLVWSGLRKSRDILKTLLPGKQHATNDQVESASN